MSECPTCARDFDDERSMKIHHTRAHDESLNERECPNCGDSFVAQHLHTGKRQQYCSQQCECDHRFERRFTAAQRDRLHDLYVDRGLSIAETARRMDDLAYTSVYRRLIAAGLHEPDPRQQRASKLADEDIYDPPEAFVDAGLVEGY